MRTDMKIEMPKSLTEMVMARLEQAIVDGEFGLGEAISEETLAKTFGVSRTPVRDALTALQRSGLVVVLPKRGSFVFQPSLPMLRPCANTASCWNGGGLRLLLCRGARRHAGRHGCGLAAMETSLTADAIAYGGRYAGFIRPFLDQCGNPYLAEAYRLASGTRWRRCGRISPPMSSKGGSIRSNEHRAMMALFADGNLEACSPCWPSISTGPGRFTRTPFPLPRPEPRRLALTGTNDGRL